MRTTTHSVSETLNLGKKIAKFLQKGDIICLFGNLGSGKTVLTKGIASKLGINPDKIISPTFVLIRQHATKNKIPFYHFDLYRLNSVEDIIGLGHEEYFYGQGLTVIEWSERLKKLMPKQCLKIKLLVKGANKRLIEFQPQGSRYKKLTKDIDEDISH